MTNTPQTLTQKYRYGVYAGVLLLACFLGLLLHSWDLSDAQTGTFLTQQREINVARESNSALISELKLERQHLEEQLKLNEKNLGMARTVREELYKMESELINRGHSQSE